MIREKVSQQEIQKIKELPYGHGSMYLSGDRYSIIYKKTFQGKRLEVRGKTVNEVTRKMKQKETELLERGKARSSKATLYEAMMDWLFLSKKPELKPTSFDRLETTIKNQIGGTELGKLRYQQITNKDIQELLNELNHQNKSWSTIKKTYDALNNFYRDMMLENHIKNNPMLTVRMLIRENINKPTKEIEFLKDDEIDRFVKEATRLTLDEKPVYPNGFGYASIIFTGIRAGEMSALRWGDIDFEADNIKINKNVELVKNRDFDESNKDDMKKKKIPRYKYIESTTKTRYVRDVSMNTRAKKLLKQQYMYSKHTEPTDYVIPTRNGNPNTPGNIGKTIGIIEKNAGIPVASDGVHVLRHTCASMMFRNGEEVEKIAHMLGNSREVCETVYVHFIEEQRRWTASLAIPCNR